MLAVKTSALTKKYGKYSGIEAVNLLVEAGDIFGIVGSDGAGKTTLLRLLMNFIFATHGEAKIFGFDAEKESLEVKEITGYVPAEVTCYPHMKAGKYIKTAMKLHKIKDNKFYRELVTIFDIPEKEQFALMDRSDIKATGLCGALAISPKVLLLDEPFLGLDKERKKVLLDYLIAKNKEGMTIIVTEKDPVELEGFCTRIATMQLGEITEIKENNGERYTPIPPQEEDTVDTSLEETMVIGELPLEPPVEEVVEPIDESEFEEIEDAEDAPEEAEEAIADTANAQEPEIAEDTSATEEAVEATAPQEEESPNFAEQSIEDFLADVPMESKEDGVAASAVAGGIALADGLKSASEVGAGNKNTENNDAQATAVPQQTTAEVIEAADNIKVTAKRFNKKAFEEMGMAMVEQEVGKVKLAYAGSVEDLGKKMQEMGFENFVISNPDIADSFLNISDAENTEEAAPIGEAAGTTEEAISEEITDNTEEQNEGGDVK